MEVLDEYFTCPEYIVRYPMNEVTAVFECDFSKEMAQPFDQISSLTLIRNQNPLNESQLAR
jgi:hypothetical protein